MLGDIHADGRKAESLVWTEWLVDIGYPFDVTFYRQFPPCTLRQLAEAWRQRTGYPEETVEEWEQAIVTETGPWPEDRRGY